MDLVRHYRYYNNAFGGMRETLEKSSYDLPFRTYRTYHRHAAEFAKFKRDFEKIYVDQEEEMRRFENFRRSLEKLEEITELEADTEFGITELADLSDEEFREVSTRYACA